MKRERRGFSLPEICVGIVIVALIIGCLVMMQINASKNAKAAAAANDGMQAVTMAMDVIGDDLAGMVFQRGDDLHIADDLKSITMLVTKPLGDDLFKIQTERVMYTIEPLGLRGGAPYRLYRTDSKGRSPLAGVLLGDIRFLLVLSGPPFKRQARLEVSAVGWQTEASKPGFAATQTRAFSIAGRPSFGGMRRRGGKRGGA